jgi:hypothetical protein
MGKGKGGDDCRSRLQQPSNPSPSFRRGDALRKARCKAPLTTSLASEPQEPTAYLQKEGEGQEGPPGRHLFAHGRESWDRMGGRHRDGPLWIHVA